jgi:hypothetical protein
MKTGRLLIAALLTTLFALVAGPAALSQAAPTPQYPPPSCPQLGVSTTTPFPGQQITVSGSAFEASQKITLVMHSDAVVLAHVTADSGGSFAVKVTIPAGTSGNHTIAVEGGTSGCPVEPIQIRVQGHGVDSASSGGGLAFTGVGILAAVAIALALITAGVILARSGRHRRSGARSTNH